MTARPGNNDSDSAEAKVSKLYIYIKTPFSTNHLQLQNLLITKSATMQLINYLPILAVLSPALGLPAPAIISTNPNTLTPMCIKQLDPKMCILNWNTNTMAVNNDLSNPNNLVAYASATVYSNTCTAIGAIKNGLVQNVFIDARRWSQSLILHNVFDEKRGFTVPRWSFNGKAYTVDNCACFDGRLLGEPKDTHVCECSFECA
ncbi:hypothetical protein BOTCAL_0091g00120 [Botryotinia calthae]|uniref:Cyanovirin-N domain-containing protein n=1 Tax=Botryotinia calthae TaxID=38488 RepID=A0A4Y8D947_9HELO|nr:hypothetical protein BOTCAL_0091g00120 [Botryotinia calthae]